MISHDISNLFNETLPRILDERPDISHRINAIMGIELLGPDGGYWTIDLTGKPSVEQGHTKEPRASIQMHVNEFHSLIQNGSARAALEAFKQKRIEATGHLPTIIKLEGLIRELSKTAH